MPTVNWRVTERCITTPAPSFHQSLANVKFRFHHDESLVVDDIRHIDGPQDWETCFPEILFDIDVDQLLSDTSLAPGDITISVIVRDRDLGRFERVHEWPLSALPADAWPLRPLLKRFSWSRRLDVAVVATSRTSPPGVVSSATATPKSTLLGAKTFRVRTHATGLDFPFKFVEPELMAEQPGLCRNTVCYVHWRGDDLHRPPVELLEVWLNKEFEDKFRALSGRRVGPAEDRSIAAQVWADVLARVLSLESDEDSDEPESLVFLVAELAQRQLDLTLKELRSLYNCPGGSSRLLPWAWRLVRADKAFANLKL